MKTRIVKEWHYTLERYFYKPQVKGLFFWKDIVNYSLTDKRHTYGEAKVLLKKYLEGETK